VPQYAYSAWQVQLYDGTVSYWTSNREANRMIASGEATRIRRKARQPYEIIRLRKPIQPSNSQDSPCCLTVSDIRINVGEVPASAIYLEVLDEKIEAFRPMSLTISLMESTIFDLLTKQGFSPMRIRLA
jgi:hypothetical protein